MKKIVLLEQFQRLLLEAPTAEDLLPTYKEDVQKFSRLMDLMTRNYVDDEILTIPASEWTWFDQQLIAYFNPVGTFWDYVQEGQLQTYTLITQALLEIPIKREGFVYV